LAIEFPATVGVMLAGALALSMGLAPAPAAAGTQPAAVTAAAPPPRGVEALIDIAGQPLQARWVIPEGAARGMVLLQHGFTRRCAHLAGTMRHWAEAGLAVLCLDVSGVAGAPWLPGDVAAALAGGQLKLPDGAPLPQGIVVAGHSAGASFAARVGAQLTVLAPDRLKGAVLLDPVGGPELAEALAAVSRSGTRPVRAVLAQPGPCNAGGSALGMLRSLSAAVRAATGDGFVGLRLGPGSTHVDAEGEDTTPFAVRACGQGWPQARLVLALRELGARWAAEMTAGPLPAARTGEPTGAAEAQTIE
jgi:pimeloyl-ACP methyl ester carboxylesterase